MPVTVKVNGKMNSLVHKGSTHLSTATIPDVCKTPSPAGPVPLPYPNISQSSTLDKGTTSVKADGGQMIAIKGSEFSMSNGDEPGSIGGVKSSTFIKESTWILFSFDVKIEGEGACRLSDKKFQNHENTADLGGALGPTATIGEIKDALCQDMCDHENKVQKNASGTEKRSSNRLEKECQASGKYGTRVEFRTRTPTPAGPAGETLSTKHTKPDAITNDKTQCFDFKLCGDSFRDDQELRQQMLTTTHNPPIEISCKSCKKCNPSCSCPPK
jgi:Domain of unknown function (DUF4150)